MVKVKVTEVTSGNSFVETLKSMDKAERYVAFVNGDGKPLKCGAILKAVIVK